MKKAIFILLLFAAPAFAEMDKTQFDTFKKEAASLRGAIDDAVSSIVPGRSFLDSAKATYLEGYGAVLTLEASLGPTRTPFGALTPQDVQKTVKERHEAITKRLEAVLKKNAGVMKSLGQNESVTVVLYLLNSNPADVPDLPSQILFTVKKQDPAQVIIREY
jgi:hypothetical protein